MTGSLSSEAVTAVGPAVVTTLAWTRGGRLRVTVIVKATFAFVPDGVMRCISPLPIFQAEVHQDDDPARSVRLTTDLTPELARVDVVFTGHAHAPSAAPVKTLPVRLGLGDAAGRLLLDKPLEVRSEAGFTRMPMVYEKAFGGEGSQENPVGVGERRGTGEPAVCYPGIPGRAAGYAPLGSDWPARRKLLGSVPVAALEASVLELPESFDWTYFQAAPVDQRVAALQGDEWVLLSGLTAGKPMMRARLPGARAVARLHGLSRVGMAEGHVLPLRADTLRLDGDRLEASITWRGSFALPDTVSLFEARIVAGVELPGQPIVWPQVSSIEKISSAAGVEGIPMDLGRTVTLRERPQAAALPFRPSVSPSPWAKASGRTPPSSSTGTLPLRGSGVAKVAVAPLPPAPAVLISPPVVAPDIVAPPSPPLAIPLVEEPAVARPELGASREVVEEPSLTLPVAPAPRPKPSSAQPLPSAPMGPTEGAEALKRGLYGKFSARR